MSSEQWRVGLDREEGIGKREEWGVERGPHPSAAQAPRNRTRHDESGRNAASPSAIKPRTRGRQVGLARRPRRAIPAHRPHRASLSRHWFEGQGTVKREQWRVRLFPHPSEAARCAAFSKSNAQWRAGSAHTCSVVRRLRRTKRQECRFSQLFCVVAPGTAPKPNVPPPCAHAASPRRVPPQAAPSLYPSIPLSLHPSKGRPRARLWAHSKAVFLAFPRSLKNQAPRLRF